MLFMLWSEQKQCIRVVQLTQNSTRCLHSVDTLQYGTRVKEETNCWIKSLFFVFFAHKKYSRSFVKLRGPLLSMGGSESSRNSSKILICVEDERRSYGFETTWGWVINDRIFIFGWTIPLTLALEVWATAIVMFDLARTTNKRLQTVFHEFHI